MDPFAFIKQAQAKQAACKHPPAQLCAVWPRGKAAPFYSCNACGGHVRPLTAAEIKAATSLPKRK